MPHVVEWIFSSISLFQSIRKYWILCNPMACSKPGYSVLHYLLELAQIHVHRVSDFIQLPHSLSSLLLLPSILPSIESCSIFSIIKAENLQAREEELDKKTSYSYLLEKWSVYFQKINYLQLQTSKWFTF